MARARNIKPGFFRNADLVELPVEARLLFIGLWTLADRSGRLEDRPKQIKMEIFPADSVDCDASIDLIVQSGMLERYEVDGKRYLQVVNFCKHQNPHRDEKASTIPEQIKHGASTVQAPCEPNTNTVAIGLNPESGFLNPDSLTVAKATLSSAELPDCPHETLIDLFEKQLPNLAQPKKSLWRMGKNAPAMKARWRWVLTAMHEKGERKGQRLATTKDDGIAWFERYFAHVARSEFLTGASGDWACDLGWLVNTANFEKVLSGNYDNKGAA